MGRVSIVPPSISLALKLPPPSLWETPAPGMVESRTSCLFGYQMKGSFDSRNKVRMTAAAPAPVGRSGEVEIGRVAGKVLTEARTAVGARS